MMDGAEPWRESKQGLPLGNRGGVWLVSSRRVFWGDVILKGGSVGW